jgi:hypothetical protein
MTTKTGDTGSTPGIAAMVTGVKDDLSTLVKDQVALAKAELKASVSTVATSSVLLAAAAFLAVLAVIFLLITAAYGLVAAGLPGWAGFGIVTLVLIIVTAILGLVGVRRLKTISGPERSKEQLAQTRALLAGSDASA